MKNAIYAATVLLVLAGSTSPAVALQANHFSDKKTTTTTTPQPGPSTDIMGPPTCPTSNPNACHIND